MKKVAEYLQPFEDHLIESIIWDTEPHCCHNEVEIKEFKSSLVTQYRPDKIDSH